MLEKQLGKEFLELLNVEATSNEVLPHWPRSFEELQDFSENITQLRSYKNPNPGNFLRKAP